MLGLAIYLIIGHICAIIWLARHKEILDNKWSTILRKYFISITVGTIVVILFWGILALDKVIINRGTKLIKQANKAKDDMLEEYKVLGNKIDINKHYNIIESFVAKQRKYAEKTDKYINAVNDIALGIGRWLGRNYL